MSYIYIKRSGMIRISLSLSLCLYGNESINQSVSQSMCKIAALAALAAENKTKPRLLLYSHRPGGARRVRRNRSVGQSFGFADDGGAQKYHVIAERRPVFSDSGAPPERACLRFPLLNTISREIVCTGSSSLRRMMVRGLGECRRGRDVNASM